MSDPRSREKCSSVTGVSGYISATMSSGRELILDEVDERLANRQVVAALDVVVVEEQHEQPYVGTRRFALLVRKAADRRRRRRVDLRVGVDLDH